MWNLPGLGRDRTVFPLHRQVDSYPLHHQGSPVDVFDVLMGEGKLHILLLHHPDLFPGLWWSYILLSPGEGNGYPLQYSCLENSMDRQAWQATIHGVAKSRT